MDSRLTGGVTTKPCKCRGEQRDWDGLWDEGEDRSWPDGVSNVALANDSEYRGLEDD